MGSIDHNTTSELERDVHKLGYQRVVEEIERKYSEPPQSDIPVSHNVRCPPKEVLEEKAEMMKHIFSGDDTWLSAKETYRPTSPTSNTVLPVPPAELDEKLNTLKHEFVQQEQEVCNPEKPCVDDHANIIAPRFADGSLE